jgi:oxygen-independent coproporphyrinogen-3 oxidase
VITYNCGERERSPITLQEQAEELLLMGLRLKEGVSLSRFFALSGQTLQTDELQELGMLEFDGDRMRATSQGRLLLNAVLEKLVSEI